MSRYLTTESTMRVGVFNDVAEAERAVSGLVQAGFRREQISVLCSDAAKEQHFRNYQHEEPAGSHTVEAAAVGGVTGGLLGGLVSLGVTTAAGLSIVAAGPSFLVGGAVIGGLIGAMQTRGHEGALADFYDQSLSHGKLLVAAEADGPQASERLQQAEQIFRDAGAAPVSLPDPDPMEHHDQEAST